MADKSENQRPQSSRAIENKLRQWMRQESPAYSPLLQIKLRQNSAEQVVFDISIASTASATASYDYMQHLSGNWAKLAEKISADTVRNLHHEAPHKEATAIMGTSLEKLEAALDKELGQSAKR